MLDMWDCDNVPLGLQTCQANQNLLRFWKSRRLLSNCNGRHQPTTVAHQSPATSLRNETWSVQAGPMAARLPETCWRSRWRSSSKDLSIRSGSVLRTRRDRANLLRSNHRSQPRVPMVSVQKSQCCIFGSRLRGLCKMYVDLLKFLYISPSSPALRLFLTLSTLN